MEPEAQSQAQLYLFDSWLSTVTDTWKEEKKITRYTHLKAKIVRLNKGRGRKKNYVVFKSTLSTTDK